ncbi:uncharacterized protein LOC125260626 [Megalobrama amblycephala]|uniref:uncharacterized protein LOC125260626 n=1 Tax=Megalobrama amblycephala TaxID=75352 RepID=UPI00201447EE|nr:uncharacterized protein LOC125260626 [Megalobrama amblycephala]
MAVPTDLSNRTVPNPSSFSGHTDQLSTTIVTGPSTSTVPKDISDTTVPSDTSTVTVPTNQSSGIVSPGTINTTVSTDLSSTAGPNHLTDTTISTSTSITTAPAVFLSSAAANQTTTSVIFTNSTHSKVFTTSTTSALPTTHLSTKASTGSAMSGEGFIILQIRLQLQYIDAYYNPASMEYLTLSLNISTELNRFFREIYGTYFLRCYVKRFWPGSVGVDTELIFKNQNVLPNATSIADILMKGVIESNVFLDMIPSSITVVEAQHSSLTNRQTQSSQCVPTMQASSAVSPVLSSMLLMLLLLLWN